VSPSDEQLLSGATFVDVASWPFIFLFSWGKHILDVLELEIHLGSAWRTVRACGNHPSSSLYLFLLPFLRFISLCTPWQWKAKPILLWVDVATELSCIYECFEYIHVSSINCYHLIFFPYCLLYFGPYYMIFRSLGIEKYLLKPRLGTRYLIELVSRNEVWPISCLKP